MHEAAPVQVVDVALRAGAHEAGRDDRALVELALLVERLAVDEPARALPSCVAVFSCTTNHSGKRQAPIPRFGSRGSFESGGGA